MMYPFMTLNDKTEIVHSDAYFQDNKEIVKVYFEKPVYGGFNSAECYLPTYEWKNIEGFSDEDINKFSKLIKQNKSEILLKAKNEIILKKYGFRGLIYDNNHYRT